MTEEIMTRIGEAAGTCSLGTFTIERDFRQHGAQLEEAFVSGLKKTGQTPIWSEHVPSWALIRASNTLPILHLSVEARYQKRLDQLKKEMTKLIKSVNAKR